MGGRSGQTAKASSEWIPSGKEGASEGGKGKNRGREEGAKKDKEKQGRREEGGRKISTSRVSFGGGGESHPLVN